MRLPSPASAQGCAGFLHPSMLITVHFPVSCVLLQSLDSHLARWQSAALRNTVLELVGWSIILLVGGARLFKSELVLVSDLTGRRRQ